MRSLYVFQKHFKISGNLKSIRYIKMNVCLRNIDITITSSKISLMFILDVKFKKLIKIIFGV